jgi:leader peptidase (prepilin peptidase)/N-methyltransferase
MLVAGILISIIGAFIGSFLGVLIYRLPKNESVVKGRSYCQSCFRHLGPLDLIPVISFLFSRGKCRYCGAKLSLFYPLIEALTAFIFLFNFLFLINKTADLTTLFFATLVYYLILSCGLIVVFFTDVRDGIIPDKVLAVMFASSLIFQIVFFRDDILNHIISLFVSLGIFAFLFLITKGRGMGLGDVKLAAVLGFVLGFPAFVVALYVAFLTGAACSIILILWRKKRVRGDTIAFGPFMVIGIFLAMYFASDLVSKFLPFLAP